MGPVCDFVIDDDPAQRKIIVDDGDGRVYTYGPLDFSAMESVFGAGTVPAIVARICKVRELVDGTLEYYDCVDDLLSPIPGSDGGLGLDDYDWKTKSQIPWGLDDDFENPTITSESCSPHDPDINIIPIRVFNPDGSFVTKTQEAKVKQELDSKFVVENLTRLVHSINAVEASSQEFSRNSAVLSQNIAEVNQYLS